MKNFTYIPKYERSEKFINELLDVFEKIGSANSKLDVIRNGLLTKNTQHTTYFNPARKGKIAEVLNDSELLKTIVETYYFDFVLFGFDSMEFA